MDKTKLETFAREAEKTIKTESDLLYFRKVFTKVTIETALNAEFDNHRRTYYFDRLRHKPCHYSNKIKSLRVDQF